MDQNQILKLLKKHIKAHDKRCSKYEVFVFKQGPTPRYRPRVSLDAIQGRKLDTIRNLIWKAYANKREIFKTAKGKRLRLDNAIDELARAIWRRTKKSMASAAAKHRHRSRPRGYNPTFTEAFANKLKDPVRMYDKLHDTRNVLSATAYQIMSGLSVFLSYINELSHLSYAYKTESKKRQNEISQQKKGGEPTKDEQENFVCWMTLKALPKLTLSKIKQRFPNYALQRFCLASMLIHLPPRRLEDYFKMYIVYDDLVQDSETYNYITVERGTFKVRRMFYNAYKMSAKRLLGKIVIDFSKPNTHYRMLIKKTIISFKKATEAIERCIKKTRQKDIPTRTRKKPPARSALFFKAKKRDGTTDLYDSPSFSTYVSTTFNFLTGKKKYNNNLLRHAFVNHMYDAKLVKFPSDQRAYGKMIGHRESTFFEYRKNIKC